MREEFEDISRALSLKSRAYRQSGWFSCLYNTSLMPTTQTRIIMAPVTAFAVDDPYEYLEGLGNYLQ